MCRFRPSWALSAGWEIPFSPLPPNVSAPIFRVVGQAVILRFKDSGRTEAEISEKQRNQNQTDRLR